MKKESILKSVKENMVVEVPKGYQPKEFLKDREGLYVWNSFIDNILENTTSTVQKSFKISSFSLKKSATDEEIEDGLPKKHLFSETEVCAIIAGLIEKQPKGEDGPLQNNGYWNLFYTKSRVVGVYWDGDRWLVRDWYRDDDAWHEDKRVFSPATEI